MHADVISASSQHSNFRIIDSQWRALFCIDHGVLKSFHRTTKLISAKCFTFLLYKTNRQHFAIVCSVIDTW